MHIPQKYKGVTVGRQLGLAFGVLSVLMLSMVIIGITRLSALNGSVQYMLDHEAAAAQLSARLLGLAQEESAALGRAVMGDSGDQIQASLKQAGQARAETAASLKQLAGVLDGAAPAELSTVDAAQKAYAAATAKVQETIASGDTDAARAALTSKQMHVVESGYQASLRSLDAGKLKAMAQAREAANSSYEAARWQLMAGAVVALLVAFALSVWITRRIKRQLGGEPGEAAALARAVAAGDLTVEVRVAPGDELSLMASLRNMRDSLAQLVGDVRGNAELVASASSEIAQGNLELSTRTEEQAQALQETSATMEQLRSTAHSSADHAKQANQLALGASTVAVDGGTVVNQVVETMKGINDSSREISSIISVIDSIAFQTNILALNAAVEAARAGEQGRGFAVVATEVRGLAQRSAEAARQIKQLITTSVQRVEHGSTLVDLAGAKMGEIVAAIKRVNDIMGDISSASSVQDTSIDQISHSVAQMDEATQRNAALVEESAAAAEKLSEQAQELVASVAVFRVLKDAQHERASVVPMPAAAKRPAAAPRKPAQRLLARTA